MVASAFPRLEISRQDGEVRIHPAATPAPGRILEYRLEVVKEGGAGDSRITQRGTLDPAGRGGEVRLRLAPGESCSAVMQLLADGIPVGEARGSCPPPSAG